MTERNADDRTPTELQQAILDVIWTHGPATADQVREALLPARTLKDSSIRTLLRRLEARGYLAHDVDGKVFVYRAAMPAQSVAARVVQQVIERFWSGSAEQFLSGMVDEKILTIAQLERLARKVRKQQ